MLLFLLQEFYDLWPVQMGEVPPYDGPKTPDGRVRHPDSPHPALPVSPHPALPVSPHLTQLYLSLLTVLLYLSLLTLLLYLYLLTLLLYLSHLTLPHDLSHPHLTTLPVPPYCFSCLTLLLYLTLLTLLLYLSKVWLPYTIYRLCRNKRTLFPNEGFLSTH